MFTHVLTVNKLIRRAKRFRAYMKGTHGNSPRTFQGGVYRQTMYWEAAPENMLPAGQFAMAHTTCVVLFRSIVKPKNSQNSRITNLKLSRLSTLLEVKLL